MLMLFHLVYFVPEWKFFLKDHFDLGSHARLQIATVQLSMPTCHYMHIMLQQTQGECAVLEQYLWSLLYSTNLINKCPIRIITFLEEGMGAYKRLLFLEMAKKGPRSSVCGQ